LLPTQTAKELDAQCGEDEEEQEEEQAEVADLGQSLDHRVKERADTLGHLQQLQH